MFAHPCPRADTRIMIYAGIDFKHFSVDSQSSLIF